MVDTNTPYSIWGVQGAVCGFNRSFKLPPKQPTMRITNIVTTCSLTMPSRGDGLRINRFNPHTAPWTPHKDNTQSEVVA